MTSSPVLTEDSNIKPCATEHDHWLWHSTLLGLLWIDMFCFQCVKWLWWFLGLSKAYYPHQHKQRGCSHVFLIWPMNSLINPSFWLPLDKHSFIFCDDLQFKLLTGTAHSIFASSPTNIPPMSTAKQDRPTVDSSWADNFKTLGELTREYTNNEEGRTDFLYNTGTQNSNICPTF